MGVAKCKECHGSGVVEFTKERGGPKCNNCAGHGYLTAETAQHRIASILDHPSVYMGGPSHGNLRKAKAIVEFLVEWDALPEFTKVHSG